MSLRPHSPAWYDRLAENQEGYYYPWHSSLPPFHGEALFPVMVRQYLSPQMDVLEVACAHGELSLSLAPHCRSVLAYDRIASWVNRAQRAATARGLTNITFVCHDSSSEANGGQPRLPASDGAFDLLICSKGPFHWILDARRVARPSAILLMLVPDVDPITPWHARLPEALRWPAAPDPNWARPAIEQQLSAIGLEIDCWWSFDVPESFADPDQLYRWLSWGRAPDDIPSLAEVRPTLEAIFRQFGRAGGVEKRTRRYIWKATVRD
jgi:SAM-dependent methyltransferase